MQPNANRPPGGASTTSWVQMSAAGASPLAAAQAAARQRAANLASATDEQVAPGEHQRLSFVSSSSSSGHSGASGVSISSSSSQPPSQQNVTTGHVQQFAPTSRLSSVLGGGLTSTSTTTAHQNQSLGSLGSSGSGAGHSSVGSSSFCVQSRARTLTANSSQLNPSQQQTGAHLDSSSSATSGASNSSSLLTMSLNSPATSHHQQLQAALGELHLASGELGPAAAADLLLKSQLAPQDQDGPDQEAQQREANRKLRLQLYVFVLRCISYPFNARQQATTGDHRQQQVKLRKGQLEQIVQAHERFVSSSGFYANLNSAASLPAAGSTSSLAKLLTAGQLKQLDELHALAHKTFLRRFLQNERMRLLVEAECCSQQDLRDLFKANAERILNESQLFIGAQQTKQRAQQQAQAQARSFASGPSASNSSQRSQQSYSSSSSNRAAAYDAGYEQDMAHEQQPAVDPQVVACNQLLSNKETILATWLARFESALREDPTFCDSAPTYPAATSAGSGKQAAGLLALDAQAANQQQQQQLTKEQLYQMFQNILNIKKFEHQLLYNALQLDSSDEQAAAIRRELDGRVARIAELERNKKLLPKFVLKEMESLYLEETRMAVNKLMVNLDSLPVIKSAGSGHHHAHSHGVGPLALVGAVGGAVGGAGSSGGESRGVYSGLQKFRRYNSRAQASLNRDGLAESHPSEPQLSKLDVVLSFNIEVIVMEVRGLRNVSANRELYCTMDIEGSETGRLQTEHVQAKKPLWDTQGDFVTNHPLPILKIKLYAVNPSMLSLEDKELGKLVLRPTVLSPKTPEWCVMQPTSSSDKAGSATGGGNGSNPDATDDKQTGDQLKIRVIVRMDRPQQLKHCGFLYGVGKSTWRKFKRRYHILIQVSQYTFVMCDFREKKSKPTEMLQLDGYTVDYIEPPTDLIMDHCAEITSAEHAHQHGSSGSSTFGLAGRLAKPFLKQQQQAQTSGQGGSGDDSPNALSDQLGSGDQQPSAIQTAAALSDELHNKFYFNVVKEGDSVVFACDDEQECFGWVMALYRATGQAHKPTPLRDQYSSSSSHYIDAAFAYNASASGREQTKLVGGSTGSSSAGGSLLSSMLNGGTSSKSGGPGAGSSSSSGGRNNIKSSVDVADQRARKHGMDEFISADPCKFQHNQLFKHLQEETLKHRLNDQFLSLGWLSSGQLFVLDEYCARYGVRTCYRHLAYLNSLLDFNVRGYFIDHTLLNYGYDFCSSFVSGQSGQLNPMSSVNFDLRPDGTVGTVTVEERDLFHCVKQKLLKMIERQLANFSYCFPYGKPDGALKATLSLLERVLMKQETANQMNSMLQNDEVRSLIRKCLEQAALNNYTKLSGEANLLLPPPGASSSQQASQQVAAPTDGHSADSPVDHQATPPTSSPSPGQPSSSATIGLHESESAPSASSFLTRKRTQSNLSAGPASNVSSSYSLSSGRPQSLGGGGGNSSTNGSLRGRPGSSQAAGTDNKQQEQQACVTMAMIISNEQVKPLEKLRFLIRLAELCCEQVEENNEYFADAFAWHSDLMMDHFELFWSLFSVDMDKVLAEVNQSGNGPPSNGAQAGPVAVPLGRTISSSSGIVGMGQQLMGGTTAQQQQQQMMAQNGGDLLGINNRDIFALFQVLNNHMRRSTNFECRKFKSYLCETFKPKLLRYIDIMESTLTRMVFKACEKDGQVNCQLIEQMFAKLDDLQNFVLRQLRWPDEQLAEQLHQRLKLISYELCDASVQRTLQAFQQLEKRSYKWTATTTSYNSPVEMIQMINLTLDTRNRSLKLCTFNGFDQMSYHSKIDKLVECALGEMQPGLMAKMLNALDSTLTKLARFDEGNLLAPILSLTYKQGMSSSGRDIGKQYVSFVSNCCDLLRHKINDELWIVTLLEDWYCSQMNIICTWLAERIDRSLHDVQLVALTTIMPKVYADMSLQGVSEDKLSLKTYQTIMSRLKMEEAASLASSSGLFEQPSTSIFNTSILSSLTSSGSASNQQQQQQAGQASGSSVQQQQAGPGQQQGSGLGQLRQQPASGGSSFGAQPGTPRRPRMGFGPGVGPSTMTSGGTLANQQQQQTDLLQTDENENMADRALQSATRMFKGFWN